MCGKQGNRNKKIVGDNMKSFRYLEGRATTPVDLYHFQGPVGI